MQVELDVFSGRVNPRWQLDADGERRLRAAEAGLPPSGHPVPEPPGLGYRGFRYVLDGVPRRAWDGAVARPDGTLLDAGRTVERLLLDLLPPEYAALRDRVARELR